MNQNIKNIIFDEIFDLDSTFKSYLDLILNLYKQEKSAILNKNLIDS